MRKFLYSISISLSLLLCLPIPILANEELYVGGDSVGVELKYDGVLVMGTYPYTVSNHSYNPSSLLQEKDVIVAINNKKIHGLRDFYDALDNQGKELSSVKLTYLRNNRSYTIPFPIVYDAQECTYKTGLYIKEAIHGIGTITFYNENNHRFAALGHAMMDEMQVPLIQNGSLFHAIITSYQKATMSTSGQKNGSICYRRKIGDIDTNNQFGIYGSYQILPSNARKYEVATIDEIKKGPAIFLTVLDQNTIESFPIEITSIHKQKELKGIEFQVKDERLLKQTGGIIQGMSGSPILQNGKIVGAITHVLVNDPTRGYGIFIENMLEAAE